MSYATVNRCQADQSLRGRVSAAIAEEGNPTPFVILDEIMWHVAAANDVEAAYASALAADNPDPGGDESVITDGMILANVQANMPAAP